MPRISVIVPCYNEEKTIYFLLDALYAQSYPRSEMEVIVADGMSQDRTREQIAAFQMMHPDLAVRLVDNLKRTIPAGLNCAIRAARGEYIVRLDAHSAPHPEYISRCVAALDAGKGDNVGGVWEICPRSASWQARAIAAAAAHPLGVGDAHYRYTSQAQEVDTVPFGAFRRSLVESVGWFDETLLTNEDYEFNTRIRQAGGKVWLDPAIRSIYLAAPNYPALVRQYWRYGYWKARMLRQYPATLRWRQALPPLFVLGLLLGGLLAVWFSWARWLVLLVLAVYLLALLAVGLQLAMNKRDGMLLVGVPLAMALMHISWGSALLWSGSGGK